MRAGPTVGARLWWGIPALLVLLWALGLLAVTTLPGLPSPPAIIGWALPVARFARDVAAVITVGGIVVGGLLAPQPAPRALRWAAGWALAWLAALVVLLVLTISDVLAIAPVDAIDPMTVWSFLTDTSVGHVLGLQILGVVVVAMLAGFATSPAVGWPVAAIALASSSAPAFLGHTDLTAGLHASHVSATVSLALHLAAVSLWVGGLAVVVALLRVEPELAAVLLPRFSLLALWCVIVVAETGLLNASLRVGTASAMVGTSYGALVLGKAVLLGGLVRLGWLQRRRVMAALPAEPALSLVRLARFTSGEFTVMGVAIAVSVVLSRLGPSAVGPPGQSVSPIAVLLLALALPLLIATTLPIRKPGRWIARLRAYPEIPAVLLLVAVVEVAGLGLLDAVLGPEAGALAGALALVGVGWLWAVGVTGDRGAAGIAIVMVGWPLIAWLVTRLTATGAGWRVGMLCVIIAEGMLLAVLMRGRLGARWTTP